VSNRPGLACPGDHERQGGRQLRRVRGMLTGRPPRRRIVKAP
jgi:hypothetical protein